MKKENIPIMWASVLIVFLLSSTSVTFSVCGIDTTDWTRDEYFEYLDPLPHFLDGTILDGTYRVVVTENGLPPDDMTPDQYDYCIDDSEEEDISEAARQQFIDTYGIDPYPPEPDEAEAEEVAYAEWLGNTYQQGSGGPHEMYGMIVTKMVTAIDQNNRPFNPVGLYRSTRTGFNRFKPKFQITTITYKYYGYWDASDVTSGDIDDYYNDLKQDCSWLRTLDNQVIYGWIRNADETGRGGGFYACSKERSNFPHKGVAQHEISHCYGAPDHGWWNWPPCVMAYLWLWLGTSSWCGSCKNTIYDHIWNY